MRISPLLSRIKDWIWRGKSRGKQVKRKTASFVSFGIFGVPPLTPTPTRFDCELDCDWVWVLSSLRGVTTKNENITPIVYFREMKKSSSKIKFTLSKFKKGNKKFNWMTFDKLENFCSNRSQKVHSNANCVWFRRSKWQVLENLKLLSKTTKQNVLNWKIFFFKITF